MFKLGFIVDIIKYWANRRYSAHYNPRFEIDSANHAHADPKDKRLQRFIEKIKIDIYHHGLKNPLLVTKKGGIMTIHPGKCRAAALKGLGRSFAPAVVVDYDDPTGKAKIGANCIPLSGIKQAQSYFQDDCVVEMTHRVLTVKKKRKP